MIGPAIDQRFRAVTGITDLVGQRIYPIKLPQNVVYPAITYFMVGERHELASGVNPGIVEGRWQVNAWGSTVKSARDVAEAVRLGFERYRGTADNTEILDVYDDETAGETYEDDVLVYRVHRDYRVWWRV